MKIRRITLPAAELAKLSAPERNLFFLVGHINNEIDSIGKVFTWCLADARVEGAAEIERNAANAQGMIFARILAGKLLEAWGSLQRSWFASKLGADIAKTLHPVAVASLDELKRYFGSKNLVFAVRNSFAFHYDPDALGAHWERAAQEPFFELVIGVNRGNSFNQAAELVANVAVFHTIAPGDAQAGMRAFFEEIDFVTGHFRNFCEGVTRTVLERLSGQNLDHLGGLSDIEPPRRFSEVTVPMFTRPDVDVEGQLP
jgi:hypothetical protein